MSTCGRWGYLGFPDELPLGLSGFALNCGPKLCKDVGGACGAAGDDSDNVARFWVEEGSAGVAWVDGSHRVE